MPEDQSLQGWVELSGNSLGHFWLKKVQTGTLYSKDSLFQELFIPEKINARSCLSREHCFNWDFFILFFRRLSLSSSNLTLDSKSIEPPIQTSQLTPNLLKNDSSHPGDASENSQLLENVNSNRAIYMQKKRRSALETSRVGMAPGRVIASFPEGPVNTVMRKAQSVHDLVHEGKDTHWNDGMNLRMKQGHLSGGL